MQVIVDIVLPIFGLVLIGYGVGRLRLFGAAAIQGLADFVYYVAVPALLFRLLAVRLDASILDARVLAVYYGGSLLVGAVLALLGRRVFRLDAAETAMSGFAVIYSNTVMLGLPLILKAFGEAGLLKFMVIVSTQAIVLFTASTLALELARGAGAHWRRSLAETAGALARNPVILAVLAGLAWRLTGWPLPAAVDGVASLLGEAVVPTALFALGATLSGFRIAGNLTESVGVSLLKLLVHPLAIFALAEWVAGLEPLWVAVLTVSAALPTGANVFILARRYGVYLQRASASVLISTGLSVITLAALVTWLLSRLGAA